MSTKPTINPISVHISSISSNTHLFTYPPLLPPLVPPSLPPLLRSSVCFRWLQELVDVNKANDQPYLSSHLLNFTIVNDCHYDFDASASSSYEGGSNQAGSAKGVTANGGLNKREPNTHYGSDTSYGSTINQSINSTNTTHLNTTNHSLSSSSSSSSSSPHTLCYLQETLFQNGQLAFMCAEEKDRKHPLGYHTEYMLQVLLLSHTSSSFVVTDKRTHVLTNIPSD